MSKVTIKKNEGTQPIADKGNGYSNWLDSYEEKNKDFFESEFNIVNNNKKPLYFVLAFILLIICIPVFNQINNHKYNLSKNTNNTGKTDNDPSNSQDASSAQANAAQAEANVKAAEANVAAAEAAVRQAEQNYKNISNAASTYVKSSSSSRISAPTQAPTVWPSSAYGSALTGTYYYKISYVDSSSNETDLGPSTSAINLNNQEAWVTNIPTSSNSNVSSIYLYRTLANSSPSGPYYLIKKYYGNYSSSTYDSKSDSSISYQTPKY